MKIRKSEGIIGSLGKLGLMILLLASAVAWRGQIFGLKTDGTSHQIPKAEINVDECNRFFTNAAKVDKITPQNFQIFNTDNKIIGSAFWYKGEHGYGGRIPLFLFTDTNNTIKGIVLGKHYETSDFLKDVTQSGFLSQWNGIIRTNALTHEVDVISGATLTSQAIISGVKSVSAGREIKANYNILSFKNLLSLALLLVVTLAYFKPKWLLKYRTILQVLSVGIFGFWLSHFLTLNQIMTWVSGGINWKAQLFIGVVFFLSVLLPVLFGKSFYCTWICPYGAAQEICGKVISKKPEISPLLSNTLRNTREVFFFIIMIIFWAGFVFDLTLIEPFAAFSITKAGYFTLALAGLFLVISLFVPKAWCKYFCPTGYMLDWIRK